MEGILVLGAIILGISLLLKTMKGNSSPKKMVQPEYDTLPDYPPDWDVRKKEVAKRDGTFCSNCGSLENLHLHHIVPLAKGGGNNLGNLVLLCEECHSLEHGGREFSKTKPQKHNSPYSRRLEKIREAISEGRKISFDYKKPSQSSYENRKIMPIDFVEVPHQRNDGKTLCVRGTCQLRKAERKFALKRMKSLKVL